jgi:hypothetical protein
MCGHDDFRYGSMFWYRDAIDLHILHYSSWDTQGC